MTDLPNILIVDDREYDRILYKEYLNDYNYEFDELDDGDLVMEHISKKTPDAIILDWQMSRLDGIDVLKLLKNNRRFSLIPTIVITGQESMDVLEQAFDYGCSDFLIKPVDKKELIVRIQNALRNHQEITRVNEHKETLEELNAVLQDRKNEENPNDLSIDLLKFKGLVENIESKLKNLVQNKAQLKVDSTRSCVNGILKQISAIQEESSSNNSLVMDLALNKKLLEIQPQLTSLDLQHCNFLRLNLSNAEIAKILFVETKSLQTTRYRIKKKLGLEKDISLTSYINQL